MNLDKAIGKLRSNGHITSYTLKFDALYDEDGNRLEVSHLSSIDRVEFERYSDEELCFLFALSTIEGESGFMLIDLIQHTDPISIEVIDSFELPNLSRV